MKTYALAIIACLGCQNDKPAAKPPQPAEVSIATVGRRDVSLYIEAVGSLDGYVNADIRARVRGYLQKIGRASCRERV